MSLSNKSVSVNKIAPLYYNISITAGYRQQQNQSVIAPAFLNELNNQVVLNNSDNYFCSVVRASIPTNYVPLLIVPIVDGITQDNINKTLYTILFDWVDSNGFSLLVPVQDPLGNNIIYFPEFVPSPIPNQNLPPFNFPLPPSLNNGVQDVRGQYYYCYNVYQIQRIYQTGLSAIWARFATRVNTLEGAPILNPDDFPILSYDDGTQLFSMNFPVTAPWVSNPAFFGGKFIRMYVDSLSVDTFNFSAYIVPTNTRQDYIFPNTTVPNPFKAYLMQFVDNYNNLVELKNSPIPNEKYIQMQAYQSNINMWGAMTKIVFSVSYGISSKQEYDTISQLFGASANITNLQKPIYSYLADLEVDRDQFSRNRNFIQFNNGGSITQSRLIDLTGNQIQSFQLSVKWVDIFGNINDLDVPDGLPLTIKLGFFSKETSII